MDIKKNKKIVLGPTSIDIKIIRICGYIGIFAMLLLLLIFNIGFDGNHIIRLIINIVIVILFLFMVGIVLYSNKKIEIENEAIIKTDIFCRKKVLGTLSDITSFSLTNIYIYVLKSDKELFSFSYHGADNNEFYKYLNNNYEKSLYIKGNKIAGLLFFLLSSFIFMFSLMELGIFTLIGILIAFLIVCLGINELTSKFMIKKDQIIIENLSCNKKININKLTTIKYQKVPGLGKYQVIDQLYTVSGYINKKVCFSISQVVPETLDLIKKAARKNKVKLIKISNK